MKKFDIQNYNEASQRFLNTWIGKDKVICVKQRHGRKDEHLVFYHGEKEIGICILTLKESKNDGSCFFGNISHPKNLSPPLLPSHLLPCSRKACPPLSVLYCATSKRLIQISPSRQ